MGNCGILWVIPRNCDDSMFRGLNQVNLDSKGRVSLPAKFRTLLANEDSIVLTIDTQEKCLLLYPITEWDGIERKISSLPSLNPTARKLQRLLIGHATEIQIDAQGRMLLPPPLREYAQLTKQVVILGQGNKCEVWDEAIWQERRASWINEGVSNLEELPEEVKNISL